ncbi:hypothetical protein BGX26_011542, partial [Mortierella sp. AD094]
MATTLTQKFRSPIDGRIIEIEVHGDGCDKFVLWKNITQSFGDVRLLSASTRDVYYVVDGNFDEITPRYVKYMPDTVLDVVLREGSSLETKDKENGK